MSREPARWHALVHAAVTLAVVWGVVHADQGDALILFGGALVDLWLGESLRRKVTPVGNKRSRS